MRRLYKAIMRAILRRVQPTEQEWADFARRLGEEWAEEAVREGVAERNPFNPDQLGRPGTLWLGRGGAQDEGNRG